MSEAILLESIWTLFVEGGSYRECNKFHKEKISSSETLSSSMLVFGAHSLLQHWPLIGNDFDALKKATWHDMTGSNQPKRHWQSSIHLSKGNGSFEEWNCEEVSLDMSMLSSVPELKNFTKKTKKLKDNTVDSPTSDRNLQLSVPHYLLRVPTSLTSVFYAPSRAISIDILKRQLLQVMATISTCRSIFSFKANLCIHIHLGNTWRIHFGCFRTLPCYLEAQGEQLVKKMSFARVPFRGEHALFFLEGQILQKSSQSQSLSQVKLHLCLRILWWPRPLCCLWPLCCLGVWLLLEPVLHCFSAASGGLHAPWCGIQPMLLKHGHTKAGLLVATAGNNQRHSLHCIPVGFWKRKQEWLHLNFDCIVSL